MSYVRFIQGELKYLSLIFSFWWFPNFPKRLFDIRLNFALFICQTVLSLLLPLTREPKKPLRNSFPPPLRGSSWCHLDSEAKLWNPGLGDNGHIWLFPECSIKFRVFLYLEES